MTTTLSPTSEDSDTGLQTDVYNLSVPQVCIEFRFDKQEFVPWNNSDTIVSEEVEGYARKVRVSVLTVLFLIGGPGNVINMVVFCRQGLRDRVNLLLFSLSLADGVYLLGAFTILSEELFLSFGQENKSGPVLKFVINNNLTVPSDVCFVSFVLSAIIAIERCYCVLRPLKYQTLMRTRTMAAIIVTAYVVIGGLNLLTSFRYYFVCAYDPVTGARFNAGLLREFYVQHKYLIDYVDIIFFGVGLPAGVMILVMIATSITATKLYQIVAWRTETSSVLSLKEVSLTKMLIGTSVLLIACLVPSVIFRIARLFLPEMNTTRRNHNLYLTCLYISQTFIYVNSSLNIFVYHVMGSRYRQTFWGLCGKNTGQKKK